MLEHLSDRGKKWVRTIPPLVKAHFDNFYNMYDKEENPEGLINMGTAESHLVDDEIIGLLKEAADKMDLTGYNIHYNKFEGSDEFRQAIADYWQDVIFQKNKDVKIKKDNVATCAGATVAIDTLATLLAEPGDVFLIPAPYYSSFIDDIGDKAEVEGVGVVVDENLDIEAFEEAYERETKKGKRVRAILFSSPNNPVGIVYKEEALQNLIKFAMKHDLEIISDEIYAQTVFDPEAHYVSTMDLVPAEYRHRVHVVSSFAKDFVLSGLRTGVCISFNPNIINGFGSMIYYASVSSHTQSLLTALLSLPDLKDVMQLSRDRLFISYKEIKNGLEAMGIPVKKAQAGIFVMADFSDYLENKEFEEEHVLWEKIYNELMVNISPGQLFGMDEPGWFRLCYAFDRETVEEAVRRLSTLEKVK